MYFGQYKYILTENGPKLYYTIAKAWKYMHENIFFKS